MTQSILFVCTGNICRSPVADGIMRHLAPHLTIDSAGIHSFHSGEAPDRRMQQVARAKGYELSRLRGRQITRSDFYKFDLILAMDNGHYQHLQDIKPKDATAQLALFDTHCNGTDCDVADPYYGGMKEFEACLEQVETGCKNLYVILRDAKHQRRI